MQTYCHVQYMCSPKNQPTNQPYMEWTTWCHDFCNVRTKSSSFAPPRREGLRFACPNYLHGCKQLPSPHTHTCSLHHHCVSQPSLIKAKEDKEIYAKPCLHQCYYRHCCFLFALALRRAGHTNYYEDYEGQKNDRAHDMGDASNDDSNLIKEKGIFRCLPCIFIPSFTIPSSYLQVKEQSECTYTGVFVI